MSTQLLPFKRAKLDQSAQDIPGMVVYDADAGLSSVKHRYYVFDKTDFANHIGDDKDTANIVVQVVKQCHSKEHVTDEAAPTPSPVQSWTKVTIVKLQ